MTDIATGDIENCSGDLRIPPDRFGDLRRALKRVDGNAVPDTAAACNALTLASLSY
jgi:hypothetical protein